MLVERGRVLIVDDDPAVRESLREELSVIFAVTSAECGEEALELLQCARFDAVVSDVRMPGMGGIALLERAAELDPALVRVFLTGYGDEEVYESAKLTGAYKLRKPWGDELEIILRNAILHRRQVDGMRGELRGYLAVARDAREDTTPISADAVIEHLRGSLSALDWVERVDVTGSEDGPMDPLRPSWFDAIGPSSVPGSADLLEQVTWIGSPGARRFRVRVRWHVADGRDEYARRVVEVALRHAAEALRMRELTDEVKTSASELEAARLEAIERDRLASLGALAASVAHDIRSPLAVLTANNSYMQEQDRLMDDPEIVGVLEDNGLAIQMICSVLDSMRAVAKHVTSPEVVPLGRVAEVTSRLLRYELTRASVKLDVKVEGDPCVQATTGELCQVFINLVTNAAQASPPGSQVDLVVRRVGDRAFVRVVDKGPGVPEANRESIFTPFHTTKAGGMGLGLPIARQIARRYGGDLVVVPGEGVGACFELSMAAAEPSGG